MVVFIILSERFSALFSFFFSIDRHSSMKMWVNLSSCSCLLWWDIGKKMSFNELKITWAVNTWFLRHIRFYLCSAAAIPRSESATSRVNNIFSRVAIYIIDEIRRLLRYGGGKRRRSLFKFCVDSVDVFLANARVRETFRFLPKVYEKRWKFIGYVAARNSLWVESSSIGFSHLNAWDVIFCLLIFFIFATSKQVVTDADNFPPISCASLLTHLRLKLPAHIFTQSTGS